MEFYDEVYIFRCWEFIGIAFLILAVFESYHGSGIKWFIFMVIAILIYVVIPSIKRDKTTPKKLNHQRGNK